MKLYPVCFVLALSSLVQALSSGYAHKVKESIEVPHGWLKRQRAPANQLIELRVAVQQPNFDELERHLIEVSDPTHPRYGQHLSKREVEQLTAPHSDSSNSVQRWLAAHGFQRKHITLSSAGDWVKLVLPISQAEKMLDTEYHVWEHTATGTTAIRTVAYSLPETLHAHIELVHPTIAFPSIRPMVTTSHFIPDHKVAPSSKNKVFGIASGNDASTNDSVGATCNNEIGLRCLQEIYNLTDYKASATSGSRIGITGYLEQFANVQDLQSFLSEQRPDALNTTFDVVSVNGGTNNQNLSQAGTEANLDVQYALGLTYPLPATFYTTGGRPPLNDTAGTITNNNEPYLDWLDFMLSQPNPPQVISTSYGDVEQTVPESYARLVCKGFAQLGARGVSLLFASGDKGVGDGQSDQNTCHSGSSQNKTQFLPVFPASCPYVTTVGATQHVPEVVADFSGGGFSNIFSRPTWQKDMVSKYLGKLSNGTYKGLYNTTGRAYPDISAQGVSYTIWAGGRRGHVLGTSAATPTVASIFALLNDARLQKGLPSLGFLNPLLYKVAAEQAGTLNDVTVGSNPGCGTEGFNAVVGWDPVSGLGTPDFSKWKDIVLSTQYGGVQQSCKMRCARTFLGIPL